MTHACWRLSLHLLALLLCWIWQAAIPTAAAAEAAPGASANPSLSAPDLVAGFQNPPAAARPRVWWHWMNGNITQEGIKLDLEWMKRAGLAGFQNFDAALETPQVVKRLAYMTPEWKAAFKYSIGLANQLGMEIAIAGSPGWSESGGPWVPASEGMKKYVWSATEITGGKHFNGQLRHPPSRSGAFQNLPSHDVLALPPGAKPIPDYYADSVVIAYRKPADEGSLDALHPRMTASSGAPDYVMLSDGDLEKATKLPIPKESGKDAWIQYAFTKPKTIRAVSWVTHDPEAYLQAYMSAGAPRKILQASDDGEHFRDVAELTENHDTMGYAAPEYTVSFAPATAKYFRVSFRPTPPPAMPAWSQGVDPASFGLKVPANPTDYELCELVLHTGARVNHWQEKAAFVPVADLYEWATPPFDAGKAIPPADVIDLTSRMRADGTLDWTPPPGQWVVLRFGYSLLGIVNHPATAEATGLEVDKLDRRFIKRYFDTYLDTYRDTVGSDLIGQQGIHYVITIAGKRAHRTGRTT